MAICISHYALQAPTGDLPAGLHRACQAGLTAYQAHRDHTAPDPISGAPTPLMLAQLPNDDDAPAFHPERLLPVLDPFIETNLDALQDSQLLLCLPATSRARHALLERTLLPWLHKRLAQVGPLPDTDVTDPQHLPARLASQIDRLMAGQIPSLTLIGLDSLLNEATLVERQPDNDLRTTTWAHGRVLSEAIALVRFQNGDDNTDGALSCTGLAHDRDNGESRPLALARATRRALYCDGSVPRPDRLVLTRAQRREDELHWYHTHTDLWPVRLSPRDNLAMRKGEKTAPQPDLPPPLHILRPALTLGDTGAASLPLALITACEALRFSLCPARTALVLDSPGNGHQLALHLQHTLNVSKEGTPHE